MSFVASKFIDAHPRPFMETAMPQFHYYPDVPQNIPRPTWKGTSGLGDQNAVATKPVGGLLDTRGWDLGLWGLSLEESGLDGTYSRSTPGCDYGTFYHYAAKQGVVRGALVFGTAALVLGAGLGFWLGRRKKR